MPASGRQRWYRFALALIGAHLVVLLSVVALRGPLGLEKLNDNVVMATVYLPLVPWRMAQAPVLQATVQMFPPPNALGWTIVVSSWVLLYAAIGYLFAALTSRSK